MVSRGKPDRRVTGSRIGFEQGDNIMIGLFRRGRAARLAIAGLCASAFIGLAVPMAKAGETIYVAGYGGVT